MGLLNGVRVLDLTWEAGAYATKLLADLGADVVKIEPLEGSPERRRSPFYHHDIRHSLWFLRYNRLKRSITLSLGCADGRALFRRLARTADVLVEDRRLHCTELGYEALRDVNPRLIYASISPFGAEGPRSSWKGGDLVAQATGGLMFRLGHPGDPPSSIGADFAYHHASGHAVAGILMALFNRLRSGGGDHVDVSLQDSISMLQYDALPRFTADRTILGRPKAGERVHGRRRIWQCKDGNIRFNLPVRGPEWERFVGWMDSLGSGDELRQPKWRDEDNRVDRLALLEEVAAPVFMQHQARSLMMSGQARGLVVMAINTIADLPTDPHLVEEDFFLTLDFLGETLLDAGYAFNFSLEGSLPPNPGSVPALGEHNVDIYQHELGLTPADFERLRHSNVI